MYKEVKVQSGFRQTRYASLNNRVRFPKCPYGSSKAAFPLLDGDIFHALPFFFFGKSGVGEAVENINIDMNNCSYLRAQNACYG